ncbi:MAG: hypothetical protein J0H84_23750 [Rhizobiales bacterium]|jgi:hypothetical protein|nr:hypothetical protein [Hyphomicrobiales bacterium]
MRDQQFQQLSLQIHAKMLRRAIAAAQVPPSDVKPVFFRDEKKFALGSDSAVA